MRRNHTRSRHTVAACLLAALLAACEGDATPPGAGQSPCDLNPGDARYSVAHVERVVDGDTIIVSAGGQAMRLRYIGIDAPESVTPGSPVEYFGPEASDYNERLVADREVCLEKDVSDTDRFGRWLRYVYVGDVFVNEQIVRDGYARAATFPPDVKHQELFREAEREAREANRGLWGEP
jgi:micrococcal nuclease